MPKSAKNPRKQVPQSPKKPTKAHRCRAEVPYNDLPLLPPTAELETIAVLKRCIPARAALAELKQAAQLIPNQAVLINTLPLLEAQSSSEIENIVTTTDKLVPDSRRATHATNSLSQPLHH
jgi:Fic family protein